MFPLIFLLSWFTHTTTTAHDFHSSLAQVQYNPQTQSFEVSLRVFTDDLELALARMSGKERVVVEVNSTADPLIEQYLKQHFALLNAQKQRQLATFVGKELETDVTWIYVEIPMPENTAGIGIQNSVLTEIFDDQVNIVNFRYGNVDRTFLFKSGQTVQTAMK